jgi:HD-GYP domain-containing protein (c-di-GMP phosphodiesterase class II)
MSIMQGNVATGALAERSPMVPGFSVAMLDTLAARFRGAGLFLAVLDRRGNVVYADPTAAPFFAKYLLPILRSPQLAHADFAAAIASVKASSPAMVLETLPGAIIAALPHVDKRQLAGIVLLAGKSESFSLDEDVLRDAWRLGLDAAWLLQQADALPFFDSAAISSASQMLASMVRDQIRLGAFEQEIDSLSTQLANSYEELTLIYQISGGMKVNRGAGDFFRQACLDVRDVMNVRSLGFALCGEDQGKLDPALFGDHNVPPAQLQRLVDQLMPVLRERKGTLLITNVAGDKRFGWMAAHAQQLIAVPLQRQDQVLGCLFGFDKLRGDFDSVDSKLLGSIANESAIYLENAILFDDVRNLMMGVLHSLTSAVDAKDAYTCGHSERVALLSKRLSREIGLPEQQIERIYMAGILHDVGKIGVPEAVLHKAGKLTNEEFDQMKKHPQIGARILADIKQIQDLIPGVLYHHERYDGKGYPTGLSGESIPLMGRIICVADCFDAMTSNRTYRRALPLEVAMIELRRCAGTQFDPILAEAFLRVDPEEFRALLREHQARAPRAVPTPELVGKKN